MSTETPQDSVTQTEPGSDSPSDISESKPSNGKPAEVEPAGSATPAAEPAPEVAAEPTPAAEPSNDASAEMAAEPAPVETSPEAAPKLEAAPEPAEPKAPAEPVAEDAPTASEPEAKTPASETAPKVEAVAAADSVTEPVTEPKASVSSKASEAETPAEPVAEPVAEPEVSAAPEPAAPAETAPEAARESEAAPEPAPKVVEEKVAVEEKEATEEKSEVTAESIEAEAKAREEGELSHEDMEQLLNEYSGEGAPSTGEIKPATVISVTSDGIVVSLGLKQEGIVPSAEFTNDAGEIKTKAGDKFEVLVEASHAAQGYIPCSADGAYRLRLWACVEEAHAKKEKVRIRVTGRIKGGFEVDLLFPIKVPGHRPLSGFIPGSQMDLKPVRHWEGFLKRELYAHIIRFNRRRGNIVMSRRDLLEGEHEARKKLLDEILVEGAVIKGTVKNMTEYGAFVDLGGLDGLLHITDISHKRLTHPSEMLRTGQEINVKILKVDKKKERVSLGMKQNEPDPWAGVAAKYKIGERLKGRVTHMLDFGAFVEIEPGVEGMIHVSEMSWTKKVRRPSDLLNEGDWVEAAVLDINPKDKRLSLGLRQTEADPFQAVAERYPAGSIVEGKVSSITDFGAFVEVEPGVDGLIHLSELSWSKKTKKAKGLVKKGEEIKAKVIKVDVLARRISLSLKDLTPDPAATFLSSHKTGDIIKGKPTRKTDFGMFVEVAEGVEGLCHISELPEDPNEIKIGKEHEFKIIKIKPSDKRLSLSVRALDSTYQKRAMKDFKSSQPRATTTLGDFMKAQGIATSKKSKPAEGTDNVADKVTDKATDEATQEPVAVAKADDSGESSEGESVSAPASESAAATDGAAPASEEAAAPASGEAEASLTVGEVEAGPAVVVAEPKPAAKKKAKSTTSKGKTAKAKPSKAKSAKKKASKRKS